MSRIGLSILLKLSDEQRGQIERILANDHAHGDADAA